MFTQLSCLRFLPRVALRHVAAPVAVGGPFVCIGGMADVGVSIALAVRVRAQFKENLGQNRPTSAPAKLWQRATFLQTTQPGFKRGPDCAQEREAWPGITGIAQSRSS